MCDYIKIKLTNEKRRMPLLLILMFVCAACVYSQNSRWQLEAGIENLVNIPGWAEGAVSNSYVWHPSESYVSHPKEERREEIFAYFAGPSIGYKLNLNFDIFSFWSIGIEHRRLHRRYYNPLGRVLDSGGRVYEYNYFTSIFEDKFLGTTLNTQSWGLKTDFRYPISGDKKWWLHHFVGLNLDLYKNNHFKRSKTINFGGSSGDTFTDYEYEISGRFLINTKGSGVWPSLNLGTGISRSLRNGAGLKLEVGCKILPRYERAATINNHFLLDLRHRVYVIEDGVVTDEVVEDQSTYHKFPLYQAGVYMNLSYTFRPFRSKNDIVYVVLDEEANVLDRDEKMKRKKSSNKARKRSPVRKKP